MRERRVDVPRTPGLPVGGGQAIGPGESKGPGVRIHEAARLTDVSAHTLRAWERRYGFPSPRRGDNRYRLYSPEDIDQIAAVARMVKSGVAPGQAVADMRDRRSNQELAGTLDRARQGPGAGRICTVLHDEVVHALHQLDEPALRNRLDEAASVLPPETLVAELVFPVIRSLADSMLTREPEKVEAFLFSQVARNALARLLARHDGGKGPLLWLACPEGELHDVALIAFAVLAARRGWSTRYFGPNTPLHWLAAAASADDLPERPSAVMLAVTRSIVLKRNSSRVGELAAVVPTGVAGPGAVRTFLDGSAAVFVGGSVTNVAARMDPTLGAAALQAAASAPADRPGEASRGARHRA